MAKFLLKILIFSIPFFALFFIEIFILPIDFFTFRVWETLKIHSLKWALPGYFYPNMSISKMEEGDLAPYTKFSTKRYVIWYTDRYGYRKKDTPPDTKHSIVVIGDSNVAGSGLSQEEIISEVLESKLKVSVYPISPGSINTFLKDVRFRENPPDIVIIANIEREIVSLRKPKKELLNPPHYEDLFKKLEFKLMTNEKVQKFFIIIDRILKWNFLHFSRAELRRAMENFLLKLNKKDKETFLEDFYKSKYIFSNSMFFLQGSIANKDVSYSDFQRAVETIKSYNEILKQRNIRLIFLPIPNKENIYYDLLPEKIKPVFLRNLIEKLKEIGIEVVDTQKAFDDAYKKHGILVFFPDDTHWNSNGVRIATELLVEQIKKTQKN